MSKEGKINAILGEFDFDVVHVTMTKTGWTWLNGDGSYSTPSVETLVEHARSLLERVIVGESECINSGGFKAVYRKKRLALYFVVTELEGELY